MTAIAETITPEQFMEKVSKQPNGCWHWTGARLKAKWDYGILGSTRAHRLSYRLFSGPIPEGMDVLHHCDVPRCVNPAHLFLGTQADNTRDAVKKGRMNVNRSRDGQPATKLSENDVAVAINMVTSGSTRRAVAKHFGVDPSTVCLALRQRGYYRWKKRKRNSLTRKDV